MKYFGLGWNKGREKEEWAKGIGFPLLYYHYCTWSNFEIQLKVMLGKRKRRNGPEVLVSHYTTSTTVLDSILSDN